MRPELTPEEQAMLDSVTRILRDVPPGPDKLKQVLDVVAPDGIDIKFSDPFGLMEEQ